MDDLTVNALYELVKELQYDVSLLERRVNEQDYIIFRLEASVDKLATDLDRAALQTRLIGV